MFYIKPKFNSRGKAESTTSTTSDIGAKGVLWKNTLALQFQQRPGYFERPVLRLFVTYGSWSNDPKASRHEPEFVKQTSGFIFGLQAEAAWVGQPCSRLTAE